MHAKLLIRHAIFIIAVVIYTAVYQVLLFPGSMAQTQQAPDGRQNYFLILLAISTAAALLGLFLPSIDRRAPDGSLPPPRVRGILAVTQQDAPFEAPAVFGMIGALLGLAQWQSYLLIAVSFCLLLASIPRVLAWADKLEQASAPQ